MPIEGKSKTTKKRTCWLFTKNRSHWKKEIDWYWTREIFFLRLWGIEESNVSSSSFTTSASRRMTERFISAEEKKIFRVNSHNLLIGQIASGRKAWQEEEETRKDTSTVLILQEEMCISELFKDIQDAVSLIPLYRTMWLFRAISSSIFTM